MEGADTTDKTMVLEDVEDVVVNVKETDEEVVEAVDPVLLNTTGGHMVCVPTEVPIE